jgi:hypothetical protein
MWMCRAHLRPIRSWIAAKESGDCPISKAPCWDSCEVVVGRGRSGVQEREESKVEDNRANQ